MFVFFRRLVLITLCGFHSAGSSATEQHNLTLVFAANMTEISAIAHGGYPQLATLLDKARQQDELTLFVFGGGSLGPSSLSSLDRGSHIIDILNTLEPDLMSVSKREFSYSEDELTLRSYEAAFPFISSNIYDPLTGGNIEGINTTLLIDKGDIRVGFIAILDEEAVEEYLLQRVQVREPRFLIEQYTQQLRNQGADLVVLMYMKQRDYYLDLMNSHKIDLALRYSSTISSSEEQEATILPRNFLLSDGHPAMVLKLSWPANQHAKLEIDKQVIELNTFADDSNTSKLLEEYNKRLHRLLNQRIGRLANSMSTQRIKVRTAESAFGNFVTDAMKDISNSDIAMINGGSIRGDKNYPANINLTRGDIVRELPFRSHLAQTYVSGAQLLDALENGVSDVEIAKGRFPQVSGMTFRYTLDKPPGQRILEVKVKGQVLEPERNYLLATTDYMVRGGDGFSALAQSVSHSNLNATAPLISEVVIMAIQKQQIIAPTVESRIVLESQ